jgi:hypothetical protein
VKIGKNWREADQSLRDDWNSQAKEINEANAPVVPAANQLNEVQRPIADGSDINGSGINGSDTEVDEPVVKAKPKRGRKPKAKSSDESSEGEVKQQKRRGRKPKKQREEMVSESDSEF